jgi:signal transduction histidine kinase
MKTGFDVPTWTGLWALLFLLPCHGWSSELPAGDGSVPLDVGPATNVASGSAGSEGNRPVTTSGPWDYLARLLSPKVRELEARQRLLTQQMADLPKTIGGTKGGSLGFHSRLGANPYVVKWVQVDLGAVQPLDGIALVPSHAAFGSQPGPGYGFPLRFRVEISDDVDFTNSELVANHTDADLANPGDDPLYFDCVGKAGRYVRVTATKLWQEKQRSCFALGELLVFAGRRNLALGKDVTASDSIDTDPFWSRQNLVDGQSVLGLPVGEEESRHNGYHSIEYEKNRDAVKWVQVDLGGTKSLDEIWLIPAHPFDYADYPAFGFPVRFRIEIAREPAFADPEMIADHTEADFSNPGENPVIFPAGGRQARYVRVTATRLWERTKDYAFALGELQVFSGAENVALHAGVTAFDSVEYGLWSTNYLVDGFSSQNRLVDYVDWIRGLARRHDLQQAWGRLERERRVRAEAFPGNFGKGFLFAGLIVVLAAMAIAFRFRLRRLREVEVLRSRIATDLHDEIGSNLGSIALLSRLMQKETAPPEEGRKAFGEISEIATQTLDSMREIVWLIHPEHDQIDDLVLRLREVAARMLAGLDYSFEAADEQSPLNLSLEFRRQVFLMFKEILHNVVKHARARRVEIRIGQGRSRFELAVHDDGVGFDPDSVQSGHGLTNLRRRVDALGGDLRMTSQSGAGTEVAVSLPVR